MRIPLTEQEQAVVTGVPADFVVNAAVSTDGKTLLIRLDDIDGGLGNGEQVIVWVGLNKSGNVYAGGVKHIGTEEKDS